MEYVHELIYLLLYIIRFIKSYYEHAIIITRLLIYMIILQTNKKANIL